jgi:peptide/nickel transport system ATP-binding protein
MTDSAVDAPEAPVLVVRDLRVDLDGTDVDIVRDISFEVAPGEILGVIGESGCGKTTVLTSLLGYTRAGASVTGGSITVDGEELIGLSRQQLRRYRGGVVAYVPQDPGGALNPALRLGTQLRETLEAHGVADRVEQDARISRILAEVKLPTDRRFLKRYPHQLSGGQQQRVTIAMAFLCEPRVAVLDEPTTGLDVTTQAHVLEAVRNLCRSHRTAGVFVSHDIAAVSGLADRIVVMYSGRVVEAGSAEEVTASPAHPYARALGEAIPDPQRRRPLHPIKAGVSGVRDRPAGCVFAPRCELAGPECTDGEIPVVEVSTGHSARCLKTAQVRPIPAEPATSVTVATPVQPTAADHLVVEDLRASYGGIKVLDGIELAVPRGAVMGLVGESGSGKSTLARCIGGLHTEATGRVLLDGAPLRFGARKRSRADRLRVQYVFQNATSALNPRSTIGESIEEPMRVLGLADSRAARRERVEELLADVALNPRLIDSFPAQLSGGERQRATVARALATTPELLICDEITSSLDVSVQASILLLIEQLRRKSDLTLLFVTHNLGVVRAICDHVAVLDAGTIVELGDVDRVLDHPEHPYTQRLLEDTPSLPRLHPASRA